jgi:N-acetylmuramoyl-L-alanine amidase
MRSFGSVIVSGVAVALLALGVHPAAAQPTAPQVLFAEAQNREAALRTELATAAVTEGSPLLRRARTLIGAYQDIARLFSPSEIADDALWQGAGLSDELFQRFGDAIDRDTAVRLLQQLAKRFPASPFSPQTRARIARLSAAPVKGASPAAGAAPPSTSPPGALAGAAVDRPLTARTTSAVAARPAVPSPAMASIPVVPAIAASTAMQVSASTAPDAPPPAPTARSVSPPRTSPLVPGQGRAGRTSPATVGAIVAPGADASRRVAAALPVVLTAIRREEVPDAVRIVLELERETAFMAERLDGPPRVFVDLSGTRAASTLANIVLPYTDGAVRQVRIGRHGDRTRVVLDLRSGTGRHSVYVLYDPYRVVVDFERPVVATARTTEAGAPTLPVDAAIPVPAIAAARPASGPPVAKPGSSGTTARPPGTPDRSAAMARPSLLPGHRIVSASLVGAPAALHALRSAAAAIVAVPERGVAARSGAGLSLTTPPVAVTQPAQPSRLSATGMQADTSPTRTPATPAPNASGRFSLARQLGLGVSRIVIDPGHGGHDPGARVRGLTEADLVLDVALRLERLLRERSGIDVVLTRRTDAFVSLDERTAIANRADADLFISVHVNASRNVRTNGVDSYYPNVAPNAAAGAVAARENASSARQMRHLPELVRTMAASNKIDESRDLAAALQTSLFKEMRRANPRLRDLGVKQAPFMVLIGATMPAALTEIAFITNRDDATRLRTDIYKQRLAEGLHAGVLRYQQSIKRATAVAAR